MEGFWAWPTLAVFAQQAAAVELAWSENNTSFYYAHNETPHIIGLTLLVLIGVMCLLVFPDQ